MQNMENNSVENIQGDLGEPVKPKGSFIQNYTQPSFLICFLVLAVAAGSMSIAVKTFGVYLKKEPLPIRKSLDLLDEKGLGPYKVLDKAKIQNSEIVESLGTEEYIKWLLEDTQVHKASAVRKCMLFITYYNLPDRVPHVPEECYSGSGHQKILSKGIEVNVNKGDHPEMVPCRYLVFSRISNNPWESDSKFSVMYVFSVNNRYANTRNQARTILNKNIFGKYSYFCKIEWNYFNNEFGSYSYPDEEEAAQASKKLLDVILPILEREHLPLPQQVEEKDNLKD